MTALTRRVANPMTEMLDWWESGPAFNLRGLGSLIRLEDYTEGEDYVVRAELPGIDPEKDVEVTVEGDILTIHGERQEEERDKNHSEFRYGSFSRSMRLPRSATTDEVKATYTDGVLEVRVHMRKADQPTPTKIPVQRSAP